MEHVLEHQPRVLSWSQRYVGNKTHPLEIFEISVVIGSASFVDGCHIKFAFDTVATIEIGKFTSLGRNSILLLGTNQHQARWGTVYPYHIMPWDELVTPKLTFPHPNGKWDIHIGSDVWIGDGARILSGVTIGDGAVIESGAVVAKDIPPYAICAGNPGNIVGYRFEPEDIEFLLGARWWDLPFATIQALWPYLCSPNFSELKRQIAVSHDAAPVELLAA